MKKLWEFKFEKQNNMCGTNLITTFETENGVIITTRQINIWLGDFFFFIESIEETEVLRYKLFPLEINKNKDIIKSIELEKPYTSIQIETLLNVYEKLEIANSEDFEKSKRIEESIDKYYRTGI